MPLHRGLPLLALVAAVFLTAGFAVGRQVDGGTDVAAPSAEEPSGAGVGASAGAPEPVESTSPPARRRLPGAEEPLRVVLAGDSVMAGLAPPLVAALESGDGAEVRFVLTPSILRDATVRFSWQKELEEFDPEVIVLLVGTWELGQITIGGDQEVEPAEEGWRDAYDREVLDPWLGLITANGAEVIWIGTPAVDNPGVNRSFAALNEAFRDAARRWPEVVFVDGGRILGPPEEDYRAEVIVDGRSLRARQVDGLHLCPDGAALLAAEVVRVMALRWSLPVAPRWDDGGWRASEDAYPAGTCPASG